MVYIEKSHVTRFPETHLWEFTLEFGKKINKFQFVALAALSSDKIKSGVVFGGKVHEKGGVS